MLAYHILLCCILNVTVIYSFSSSPRRRFSNKPKYRAKIFFTLFLFLTTLLLSIRISLLFFNQSQKNFTDPGLHKIRHSSLVCCRGLALLHFFALATLTFLGRKVTELIIDNQLSSTIEQNTSPIHGPLPMIIFFNLILVRSQTARLF